MKLRQYHVDAFAARPFEGNPAAVCPLDHWPDDALLQAIAAENNLSETAFFVPEEEGFRLRWFTPVTEVDLCGHATLASAHVLYHELGHAGAALRFQTRSGVLRVSRDGAGYLMDFPARPPVPCEPPAGLVRALGAQPAEVLAADDYVAVFEDQEAVRALEPDFALLRTLDRRGVVVTAPGAGEVDFVSRFFAPGHGIPEDPVTGSAHCELAPYWGGRLGRDRLRARQLSARGGELACSLLGERVGLSGTAVTFMWGEISL